MNLRPFLSLAYVNHGSSQDVSHHAHQATRRDSTARIAPTSSGTRRYAVSCSGVQPSGHTAWVVTWEHGKRRTLGSAGHLTLDDARETARKIIAEHSRTALHFRHA